MLPRSLAGLVLAVVTALIFVPFTLAQEKAGPVQISWHGQSFFTIKSTKGTTIVIDPHQIPEYGRLQGLKADAVLMSHLHNDHTQLGVVENIRDKDVKILPGLKGSLRFSEWIPIDEKIKDVHIYAVGAYHDNMQGMKYGKNTIFVIEVDGWRIVHLGDLGHQLTPAQLKKIGPVDVLMIPVGGIYTLNGSEAKKVVEQIKPKEYIFPMHCGTKVYDELLTDEEFLDGQPRENVAKSDDNLITLNKDPQRPRPLIVELHYWPKK